MSDLTGFNRARRLQEKQNQIQEPSDQNKQEQKADSKKTAKK